jgi:hypothetical protein
MCHNFSNKCAASVRRIKKIYWHKLKNDINKGNEYGYLTNSLIKMAF